MAARRDRERRRPSGETRYRFDVPGAAVEPDEGAAAVDGAAASQASTPARTRSGAIRGSGSEPKLAALTTRGGTRAAPLPFSSYAAEYAYVLKDLRRVGLVIGSLLVILILLYFVLPH